MEILNLKISCGVARIAGSRADNAVRHRGRGHAAGVARKRAALAAATAAARRDEPARSRTRAG